MCDPREALLTWEALVRVCEIDDDGGVGRHHPWTESNVYTPGRYYNFVKKPSLIREVLEDFRSWESYRAVERFYRLLEFLNGPECRLETSECMFRGVIANSSPQIAKEENAIGRLMILFREITLNTSAPTFQRLYQAVMKHLTQVDPSFEWGSVGVGTCDTRYLDLPRPTQWGRQLLLNFWAWGDNEVEAMDNLDRLFQDLHLALANVSAELE